MATTNLDLSTLEDNIVAHLETSPLFADRVFAATTPLVDLEQYPALPVIFVSATGDAPSDESQPIGSPLRRKVDITVEVAAFATSYRARGEAAGMHEIVATVKDMLMGYDPGMSNITRPLIYRGGNVFDFDEEEGFLSWLSSFGAQTQVREVI